MRVQPDNTGAGGSREPRQLIQFKQWHTKLAVGTCGSHMLVMPAAMAWV